eukprot:Sdes_comp19879_c0_seq1m12182
MSIDSKPTKWNTVESFLEDNAKYFILKENNSTESESSSRKVLCILTNHELPYNLSRLTDYLKGRGFRKALQKEYEYAQHEPHISEHPSGKMFCNLTKRFIKKCPKEISRHIAGRRYQNKLRMRKSPMGCVL